MRVVLVAETFLPQMNGVVNSVIQILRHLRQQGHEALVIAPRGAADPDPAQLHGARFVPLGSLAAPGYPEVRVSVPKVRRIAAILEDFQPDVVHLASPFTLGWKALRAADRLGIPTVAVYQTDIPGYAARYGLPGLQAQLTAHVAKIHGRATVNLVPSSASMRELDGLGARNLRLWARGVDSVRFAPGKRSAAWRRWVAPNGELVIGYVGRLAAEKQVEDLAALAGIPGTRVAIVGDGPSRAALSQALPDAAFLGFQSGEALAEAVASFDVFVHPGEHETFCQTVQEALASGVPVVAVGRGGPVDLVQSSRTGWLYQPGDLNDLRARVLDLIGDDAKRAAFGSAARESVAHRTWARLGDEILGHYRDAMRIVADAQPLVVAAPRASDASAGRAVLSERGETSTRQASAPPTPSYLRWQRYIALGDSLTEGLSDASRQAAGEYRGWADRLATYLASAEDRTTTLRYANLAVRSRRVEHVVDEQVPRAIELGADLATVLVGGNDVLIGKERPELLAARLLDGVDRLRESGADVLLVTPFGPYRWWLGPLQDRFMRFGEVLLRGAPQLGATVLDFRTDPLCRDRRAWAEDRLHLSSYGHRALSYRAGAALGIPGADAVGALDLALHDEPLARDTWIGSHVWLWRHLRPWIGRRLRGVTAGDGLVAKHDGLVEVVSRRRAPHRTERPSRDRTF
ncbi:MAG: glycosyltransferase [Microbacteriaceae bacterium]|nr:glycosyltransferase [Microbacteriaceae bacterium]